MTKHISDQPYLSDAMRPPGEVKIPEIDDALDAWLEAKVEQRRAADTTKIRHLSLLDRMTVHGIERYPFVDRTTGKKQEVVNELKHAAKVKRAPRKRDRDEEPGEEVTAPKVDDKVESRRVSRASVEAEIGKSDPFAGVRDAIAATKGTDVTITLGDTTTSLKTGNTIAARKTAKPSSKPKAKSKKARR